MLTYTFQCDHWLRVYSATPPGARIPEQVGAKLPSGENEQGTIDAPYEPRGSTLSAVDLPSDRLTSATDQRK